MDIRQKLDEYKQAILILQSHAPECRGSITTLRRQVVELLLFARSLGTITVEEAKTLRKEYTE